MPDLTMITSRNAYAVAAVACLTSCTSILPYAPPATRPEARVRIVIPATSHFPAQAFGLASGSCDGSMMDFGTLGGNTGVSRTPIGMIADPSLPAASYMERKVPAGKPYMLFARVGAAQKTCGLPVSFRPEADADYQATITGEATACQLVLSRLSSSPEGSVIATAEATARSETCPDLK